jgi:hypothetical protein
MAKPQDRALAVAVTLCLVFLFVFGVYVWTATVIVKDTSPPVTPGPKPTRAADPQVSASLRVDSAALAAVRARGKDQVVTAELSLTNVGPEMVSLLDGVLPSVLLEVRLFYLGQDGRQAPRQLPVTGRSAGVSPSLPRCGIVDLMPGRTLSLPVGLSPQYDLTAPGRYRLEVGYRPAAYVNTLSLNASESGVMLGPVTPPPLEFEVPAAPPAEAPPPASPAKEHKER